jgi:lipid-binding SYLF domain-containing protein
MVSPDRSIPEELLAKCKAIAIYPRVLKGAFIFGARIGRGVVLAKNEAGDWGPVAFSTVGGVNFGFQIGGEATDIVLVILNDRGLSSLLSNNVTLGADAAVAAGPVGRKSAVATDLFLGANMVSYSRNLGLFAGVSLDGSVLTQDNYSNSAYYGKSVTSKDILLGGAVEPQSSSEGLRAALKEYAARWQEGGSKHAYETAPDQKADFKGEIESVDYNDSSVNLIDTAPMNERKQGAAANLRVKLKSKDLASVKIGDEIQVYFETGGGRQKEARMILKVPKK